MCRPASGEPSFTEVTGDWNVTALATSVRAGDLDGDGYPDLVATVATDNTRGTTTRFLLLNEKGQGLRDATAESGILGDDGRVLAVANLGDLDNDGDLDLVACPSDTSSPDPCVALLNDGHAHFTPAPASMLDGVGVFASNSMALLDFDRDGHLDLWPATYGTHPWLFQGHGDGTFDEVGGLYGLPQRTGAITQSLSWRRTFGVTACDLDGDGDLDVLLADYGREANWVYRWDGDHFTEVGQSLGLWYDDRMDYSDDLSYRCFCGANPGQCPQAVPAPPIGFCPGRGWVQGESDMPWRLGGNTFSFACGDIDDDGDLDLMTAEIRHGDVGSASDPSELILNQGGTFVRPGNQTDGLDRAEQGFDWNEGDMMPVFADVDLDGHKDIYLSSSDYPGDHGWLWRNRGDGTFEDVTARWSAGLSQIHGVALVDLDLDGDLDLVGGTSTARGVAPTNALRVFRNDLAGGNFLRLTLVGGDGSNRAAIGARVKVTTGDHTQVQEVSGGYGHASMQHDLSLTFGLGDACTVDEVEVRWPDAAGTVERFSGVRGNYRVEIREGQGLRYLR